MKAVILAAGVGSRLRPITDHKPKTLVKVNDLPILKYILDSLMMNAISEIIICVGYRSADVINYCELNYPNLNITFVVNKEYDTTNNMYSLYLAKDFIHDDILLMNADLVFEPEIIGIMKKQKISAIAIDRSVYFEESMKVKVDLGRITSISKKISQHNSYGCSLDIYKLVKKDIPKIIKEMERIIIDSQDVNQWTEVMLDNLFKNFILEARPICIDGKKWVEIDNFEDLAVAETMFSKKIKDLSKRKIFFIDRDGTLTLGDSNINGSEDILMLLERSKKYFFVLTNNSSKTPIEHAKALKRAGLNIKKDKILLSTDSACSYLKSQKHKDIYWVANKKVSKYLKSKGFTFNKNKPTALLLTYDDELTYDKLRIFCQFVDQGLPYFATHTDIVCPTTAGFLPDIGTFIEAIRLTTGREPNITFGKPSRNSIDQLLRKLKLNYSDAVIIGDRLYTDIKLSEGSDIVSVLVLTGETKRDIYEESKVRADIIVKSIANLREFI